ncbi:adenylate kinase [soil metagenome]
MIKVVLLGAPGSGKGTQARRLAGRYGIPQVSTGDLLREAVAAGTDPGRQAKAAMDAGELVSDDIVLGFIRERLAREGQRGFVLDGFPRNETQAEALARLLDMLEQPLDAAILMNVDFDALMRRLVGRRTCRVCGRLYNVYFNPPQQPWVCDACGGRLEQRSDDNEQTIRHRLEVYEASTRPLIAYYETRDLLQIVDAEGDIDDVCERLVSAVEHARKERANSGAAEAPPDVLEQDSDSEQGG